MDLGELIDRTGDPLLGGAYCVATGAAAGDDPVAAVRELGPRLWHARVRDQLHADPDGGRTACPLGNGEVPNAEFVAALAAAGYDGWIVYEWDRLWLPDLAAAESVLPAAAAAIFEWSRRATPSVQPA